MGISLSQRLSDRFLCLRGTWRPPFLATKYHCQHYPSRITRSYLPMNPVPTTTIFFPLPPAELLIFCASSIPLNAKIPFKSLNPGIDKLLGVPPVQNNTLLYPNSPPLEVLSLWFLKSTDITSVERWKSTPASEKCCALRHSIFFSSAMSALESLVRSMGRWDSRVRTVILPLKPFSRRPSIAPIVAEPLSMTLSNGFLRATCRCEGE